MDDRLMHYLYWGLLISLFSGCAVNLHIYQSDTISPDRLVDQGNHLNFNRDCHR